MALLDGACDGAADAEESDVDVVADEGSTGGGAGRAWKGRVRNGRLEEGGNGVELPVMEFGSTGVLARGIRGVQRIGVERKRVRSAEVCISYVGF